MNDRSAKKMATVERAQEVLWSGARTDGGVYPEPKVFFQTGLVQRILGFGWRLKDLGRDVNLIRPALWLMPVSVGVAFLEADDATIMARNRGRRNDPATAHEDRSFQVPLMRPAIAIAKEVLHDRAVPVASIDVQHQSIEAARAELLDFAYRPPCQPSQIRSCGQMEVFSSPPWWWRS
jgi:hypothetical protein